MAVAAEAAFASYSDRVQVDEPRTFAIPELVDDAAVRRKAASFIGAVATGAWNTSHAEVITEEALAAKPIESLYDAVQAAYNGDLRARKLVETNAFTDAIERTIKTGHVMEVELTVDEARNIQQHGQTLDSVQANSLRYAARNAPMRARVEAETRNAFRLKHHLEQGTLEDYRFVTFSLAADDMSMADMRKAGFFTDTMSAAIQVTSANGNNLVMETAFVAGAGRPGAERHDRVTTQSLMRRLGIESDAHSATKLLDTPLLVHKSLMPDGAINLVEMYDECAGGTFFGELKPRQDYREYRGQCAERGKSFRPKVEKIVSQLISEAPLISSRVMAIERLEKISGKHMIDLAGTDKTINPEVFGTVTAARIEVARLHYERGNTEQALVELDEAAKTDRSSSCPSGLSGRDSESADTKNGNSTSNDSGDCEFRSNECPECHKKKVWTKVRKIGNKKRISGDCGCSIMVKADY